MKRTITAVLMAGSLIGALGSPAAAKPTWYSVAWQNSACSALVGTYTFTRVPHGATTAFVRIVTGPAAYGQQSLTLAKGTRQGSVSTSSQNLVGTAIVAVEGWLEDSNGAVINSTLVQAGTMTCA